jgi:hypothetical protein
VKKLFIELKCDALSNSKGERTKRDSFLHPVSHEPVIIQAELGAEFKRTLEMFIIK